MPPKKRAGRKSNNKDWQSQSQDSQSQQSLFAPQAETQESVLQFNAESIEGLSLPSDILVTLAALPSELPLNAKKQHKLRVAGEEAIADVCARVETKEGRLEVDWDENRGVKRRRLNHGGVQMNGGESLPEVVPWYTAGLIFPCICKSYPLSGRSQVS